MKKLKSTALALALACGAATAAQAVTVTNLAFDTSGAVTSFNVEFSWNGTPYNETNTIALSNAFDFSFVSYSGTASDQTGYILEQGSLRLTTASTACNSSTDPLIGNGAGCNLVNASTAPGVVFANLAAGTYTLGVFDSATPINGSVVFNFTRAISPVPLPAGGALLLAALGVLRWRARRKLA